MDIDKEIYKTIFQSVGDRDHLMKVILYCTTRSENPSRYFRANQIIKHALLLQDETFKVHLGEFQDPSINENGEVVQYISSYIHNHVDIDKILEQLIP
jgi:hypothetical protein